MTVSGWGKTQTGRDSDVLMSTVLTGESNCPGSSESTYNESVICAWGGGKSGTCFGDSGGEIGCLE